MAAQIDREHAIALTKMRREMVERVRAAADTVQQEERASRCVARLDVVDAHVMDVGVTLGGSSVRHDGLCTRDAGA